MSVYNYLLKNPFVSTISNHIDTYPTPVNLTYLWGFGSLAGIALVIQIVTGVLLAMHYASEVHIAFASVEHIMRDVNGGAALRYIHANGASMFLLIVYIHMFRGLYFGSYFQPRATLWYSGIAIFLAMMATGFLGYVLPWGQMSFWGATVITNLFSAIPYIGDSIVQLLWGGFSVDNPTLNRFYSLHYFIPFIIAALAFLHLVLLHQPGSNNPLGVNAIFSRIPFYPYFYVKDLFGFTIFVWIFSMFVIYAPNYLGHPDNYIEANPLVTPPHIVPEWYFLPFYAILRSIPDKLGGVLLMVIAILILAVLPLVDTSSFRSTFFKPLNIWLFWYFFADSICLGWIGQEIVESPFIEMGVFVTLCYFLYFIPMLPLAGFLENAIIKYELRFSSILFLGFVKTSENTKEVEENLSYLERAKAKLFNSAEIKFSDPVTEALRKEKDIDEKILKGIEEVPTFKFPETLKNKEILFHGKDEILLTAKEVEESLTLERITQKLYKSDPSLYKPLSAREHTMPYSEEVEINLFNLPFNLYIHWFEIFQVCFIAFFLLSLSLFFSKTGNFTRFVNKLGFAYLIFELWRFSFDIVVRLSPVWNQYWAESSISDLATLRLNIENDPLFSKLFFIYALLIVSIFFYGVADRFFIANSYEIEFPILVFFIHVGALFLFSVNTFIEFVIAIEIVTLATYTLTAFDRRNRFSTFAGVQYFILGSIPSGLLVLGVALLYKSWGTLAFENLDLLLTDPKNILSFVIGSPEAHELYEPHNPVDEVYAYQQAVSLYPLGHVPTADLYVWEYDVNLIDEIYASSNSKVYLTYLTVFLLFFNFLFKITAAPFHFWAPSIYGNSPLASVTFLSIFSKAMIFFVIVKLYFVVFSVFYYVFIPFLVFCSVLSVFFGMIGAFSEKGIKRFFVYSSMGHVGFMLVSLSLTTYEGISATFHYLPVYIITSFIMWFILLHMGSDKNQLIHFKALKNSDPLLALIFSLIIFSMSGIPPLGGFFVKLDVLSALLDSSRFYTNYILLFFTVASFFYYLRVVKIIFFDEDNTYLTSTNVESSSRLWMISLLFLILLGYLFIIQKPLLMIQAEALATLF